jgi:hypothetical protein
MLVSKWILEAFLATFELGEALGVVFLTPQLLFVFLSPVLRWYSPKSSNLGLQVDLRGIFGHF